MSKKNRHIADRIAPFQGREQDAHYLGYFDLFNRQLFYEAHDVLEELWLADRRGPDGDFYKGLIQLAGAFVHVQKHRPSPACALLRLAGANLEKYLPVHHQLDVKLVIALIENWSLRLQSQPEDATKLAVETPPKLALL